MTATTATRTDAQLHAALLSGDPAALEELYDAHSGVLYAIAWRVTGSRTAAEDVVQDVVVQLWERPYAFDPAKGSLRGWLSALAHHKSVDWVRREMRRRHLSEQAVEPVTVSVEDAVVDAADDADTVARMRRALESLPPPQRQVVELAYFHSRSYRQVAEDLGLPEGTVKSRIRLALAKLEAAVREEEA